MRIIAGKYKGRDLLAPAGVEVTRPITGAVKKSLFGMLGEDLSGQYVLDLYCGTGTLGIESLSRGATHCCFADRDPSALARLRRNLHDLAAESQATVWVGDIAAKLAAWLKPLAWKVDVAFVDPPYAASREWDWTAMEQSIFVPLAGAIADDGVVVLRVDGDTPVPQTLGPLALARHKQYGYTSVAIMKKPPVNG